jgi:hypothetical protein
MVVNIKSKREKGIKKAAYRPVAQEVLRPGLFRWILLALVISAMLELLLWRTFSRIGIFIPKQSTFQTVYNIGRDLGRFMLTFAVLMVVLALVLAVLKLREAGRFGLITPGLGNARSQVAARSKPLIVAFVSIGLVLFITLSQLFPLQEIPVLSLLLRLSLIVAFSALAAEYWQNHPGILPRLFIGILLAGYVIELIAKIMQDYLNLPNGQAWFMPMVMVGEGAVLLNGVVLYLVYGGGGQNPARSIARNWPAFVGALLLTGTFLGLAYVTVAESDIVPILGLYALGYTMQLPLAMYVIALFFLLYTIFFNLGHLREGKHRRAAAFGLILVFTGGYLFNISNQYLFALAGVLLLARPELVEDWYAKKIVNPESKSVKAGG